MLLFTGYPIIEELPEKPPLIWEVWQDQQGNQTFLGYRPDYWGSHKLLELTGSRYLPRSNYFSVHFEFG